MWTVHDASGFHGRSPKGSALRQIVESLVLLALAVVLFRGFGAEGYLISTGSMAPSLLGYHHHVVCPACRFSFARGAASEPADPADDIAWASHDTLVAPPTSCPVCGESQIDLTTIPRNEGDQLLVHKNAYEFRDPERWEVIVFRNPRDARQAYVKRVIGLPGERVEIRQGDLYADGILRRKPWLVQRAIRIPVADYAFEPGRG